MLATPTWRTWYHVKTLDIRAIFVWHWNENARTKQKQQTNGNSLIDWFIERIQTRVAFGWLVKRMLGWKNFLPENFLEINGYFALTLYCNTIGQSNNAFSILGFSLAGKRRVHVFIFSSIGLWNRRPNTYRNHFSRSYENRSIWRIRLETMNHATLFV